MSKRINFVTLYETQHLIQSEKDMYCIYITQSSKVVHSFNTKVCNVLCRLFLVGYGITYIQPTYQSLLHLQDYGNDTGLEKQGQVKVCLIDQEAHVCIIYLSVCLYIYMEPSVLIFNALTFLSLLSERILR